ncbi:iron permease [Patulibacter minatonensis]|uniref:iron permease n=1 Tax=Patulibacter minatonensis TaxID=298163 RepID=UPI0012FC920B|nr:iron permease [Patulibacter minatonensis]
MSATPLATDGTARAESRTDSRWFYAWLVVVLGLLAFAVVAGWNAAGGTVDPTDAGRTLSRTTVVVNSAVLVLREGLECVLVLAAITAGLRGPAAGQRRPIAIGGGVALLLSVVTWFAAVWVIGAFGGTGLNVQAATGIPAILVLLVIMNWFFHDTYWTGWIKRHNRKKKGLLHADAGSPRLLLGLGLLGFSAVYREGFEIVLFLQSLRVGYGSSVVLEGVTLGLLFTTAAGIVTFVLHRKLPYKKLLIITFALLVLVLFVMVGEQVNEMQLAGWIGTSTFWDSPGWLGTWFSVFGNWETVIGQTVAVGAVVGSYVVAREVQVKGPQRRARRAAAGA